MKVSIITLTYNKADLVESLAKSLVERCTGEKWQWVLIDNGTDDTLARIQAIDFKGNKVKYLKHDNSGNFSSMNNRAVNAADGDTLIFLNNDTVAESDFVTEYHNALSLNENVGAVGACLYYYNGMMQHCGVVIDNEVTPGNLGFQTTKFLGLAEITTQPEYWGHAAGFQAVTGACLGIRKNEFKALDGFHEEFSWCFEDVDLCFRVGTLLGKACVVLPEAKLVHYESISGGNRNVDFNLELLRGRWHGLIVRDTHVFKTPELFQTRLFRLNTPKK